MQIINSKVEFVTPIDREDIIKRIETAGRTCYKSESNITEESASKFVKAIVKSGHHSVIEHVHLTVRITTNRGVSHEIVRHRLANYSQESSRYVDYTKDKFGGQVKFIDIREGFPELSDDLYKEWLYGCQSSEACYQALKENGAHTDIARSVLNNSVSTEIVMTANLREWLHFCKIRSGKDAHPEIRVIAYKLLKEFKDKLPEVFDSVGK